MLQNPSLMTKGWLIKMKIEVSVYPPQTADFYPHVASIYRSPWTKLQQGPCYLQNGSCETPGKKTTTKPSINSWKQDRAYPFGPLYSLGWFLFRISLPQDSHKVHVSRDKIPGCRSCPECRMCRTFTKLIKLNWRSICRTSVMFKALG